MTLNTITPRLQNSSINGKRFSIAVDAVVKTHLDELNSILGKASFSENVKAGNNNSDVLEEMKNQLGAARDESEELQKESENAEGFAQEAENRFENVKTEIASIREKLSQAKAGSPDKKLLTDELRVKQIENTNAKNEAVSKRRKATSSSSKYTTSREKVDELSQEFVATAMEVATAGSSGNSSEHFNLQSELKKPIFAKKTEADKWDNKGILNFIIANENIGVLSISDCIDMVNELSNLKNDFQNCLNQKWNSLTPNQKAVFNNSYKNIADYLIAYGYFVKGITEVNALFNFITTHKNGAAAIVNFGIVSAVRTYIQKNALKINPVKGNTYNDDEHPLIKKIMESSIEMDEHGFAKEISKKIKSYIANGQELKLIEKGLTSLKIDDLPNEYYPKLVQQIRNSSVKIDEDNIPYFLAAFINNIKGETIIEDTENLDEEMDVSEISDEDFDVNFTEDIKAVIKTSLSNLKAARQLFSSAIMEMDLDIFGLANYLTDNYLVVNRTRLDDKRLRDNLEMFVFSNQFTRVEKKTGKIKFVERTKAGDRMHFYRQVFNISNSPLPQGVIVNTKFSKLWKNLIPTVKKYIDESASSLSSDSFVSKGGVTQLVSGLQINLSANCTGMATVMAPNINAEVDFIKDKIFGHPEIIKQIAPTLGSWKGVAETLYASMKHRNNDATLIYQKSQLCYKILDIVAHFDAHVFELQDNFLNFCSIVIELDDLTQSIASEFAEENESMIKDEKDNHKMNGTAPKMENKATQPAHAGNDEWDF